MTVGVVVDVDGVDVDGIALLKKNKTKRTKETIAPTPQRELFWPCGGAC